MPSADSPAHEKYLRIMTAIGGLTGYILSWPVSEVIAQLSSSNLRVVFYGVPGIALVLIGWYMVTKLPTRLSQRLTPERVGVAFVGGGLQILGGTLILYGVLALIMLAGIR